MVVLHSAFSFKTHCFMNAYVDFNRMADPFDFYYVMSCYESIRNLSGPVGERQGGGQTTGTQDGNGMSESIHLGFGLWLHSSPSQAITRVSEGGSGSTGRSVHFVGRHTAHHLASSDSLLVSADEAVTGFRVAFHLFPGSLGWKGNRTTFVLFTGGQENSQWIF